MARARSKAKKLTAATSPGASVPAPQRVTIFVSSSVYGSEDLLDSVYALLESFGYRVLMSHKGTVPIAPGLSAMDNCLAAVKDCDLFLGLIFPWYGTGKLPGDLSITHREALFAIELNKPRWFLVHQHVVTARTLLRAMRDKTKPSFVLLDGVPFESTSVLSDLRVIDLYEAAMRHDIVQVADRTGNWVQTVVSDDEARLFVTAQFLRQREVLEKHLAKLEDVQAIAATIKRGRT